MHTEVVANHYRESIVEDKIASVGSSNTGIVFDKLHR